MFTFTRLLAEGGETPFNPVVLASLELEASLAKKPNVYLKLNLDTHVLEVKSRGLVLDTIVFQGLAAAQRQPFFLKPVPLRVTVPAVLQVQSGPGDTDREIIAPEKLLPAKRGDEEDEPTPTPTTSGPRPTPTKRPEEPSRYRVEMTNGLVLWVTDALPAQSFWQRSRDAVKEGLEKLLYGKEPPQEPPGVVLVVRAEDARRLHHLFRSGMQILVTSETLK